MSFIFLPFIERRRERERERENRKLGVVVVWRSSSLPPSQLMLVGPLSSECGLPPWWSAFSGFWLIWSRLPALFVLPDC
jgi:hypothetical protein